ncbi:hypothetical protein NCS57_01184500 [Fusarium keratoplasticum]|uniref:Uncharacterized protein n=1 Tax=Fusarium keratoplasticum TaxID=1328300 RepID=A0ACC0QNI8_9HYPO|nr:hypothetical protein NCS57_01184500 [Fusarium keratoplasticum]KAI8658039.1 hypothetical protein NCS57_01184500 [Fusarium keratoplasticum]KAI8659005.1 hypothetical protein NCS55_01179600 [Fusarium keratoplasticum]
MAGEPGNDIALRFWSWQRDGGDPAQRYLWDFWRFSGILDGDDESKDLAPDTDMILFRLMESVEAAHQAFSIPCPKNLPFYHGLVYPLMTISLEVSHLKGGPEWKQTLVEVRSRIEEISPFRLARMTFKLLDDAWLEESSDFDIEGAARRMGV